jgi:hypothetical protein
LAWGIDTSRGAKLRAKTGGNDGANGRVYPGNFGARSVNSRWGSLSQAPPIGTDRERVNVSAYVERVNFHLERLGVTSRPAPDAYVDAYNNQIPARKMAESYQRRLHKEPKPAEQ